MLGYFFALALEPESVTPVRPLDEDLLAQLVAEGGRGHVLDQQQLLRAVFVRWHQVHRDCLWYIAKRRFRFLISIIFFKAGSQIRPAILDKFDLELQPI